MGVPSFYRWLINKYPKVVANAVEAKLEEGLVLDTSLPNPNGIEFDNLYLDVNGIIHPCFHPEDEHGSISQPNAFEDVFNNVFGYIDRIFSIIRPRKVLYMAIDGVAPRANMNQQRARRFRTAKDKDLYEEEEARVKKEFESEGKFVLPREESETCDSNIITPGTEFMDKLSKALKSYISSRLSNASGWKNIKVILSDANVPGEGEHKIMSFIRSQRAQPSYDPNTRHCLYGLDADLIMLALATHEIHFSILREDMLVQEQKNIIYKPVPDHRSSSLKSRGWFKNAPITDQPIGGYVVTRRPYQLLHVWILKEYLSLDMRIPDPPEGFKFDLERIVDDFIFMCFFVGNDFLPHTPSLAIHENALDLLMTVYKREMKNLGGYMVDMTRIDDKKAGFIKLSRVEKLVLSVAAYEEKIFAKRSRLSERKIRQLCSEAGSGGDDVSSNIMMPRAGNEAIGREAPFEKSVVASDKFACEDTTSEYTELVKNTKELKEKVKDNLRRKSDLFKSPGFGNDRVRLGSPGFRERYYKEKFGAESPGEIESTRKKIVEKFTEGLLWVLLYYFSGPPSWTWHYPFHYGPLLSDLKGLSQIKLRFQKDFPFKPFDQLLSVLPPRSLHALPKAYQSLMNEDSPIIDFYPSDFEIDMDGKRFTWQGVCKLPFIDERRLLVETKKLENNLEVEEAERNSEKLDQLLVLRTDKVASNILSVSAEQNDIKTGSRLSLSDGIYGSVRLSHTVTDQADTVLCFFYELPSHIPHSPRLLDGVLCPEVTIRDDDIEETQLWHEYYGTKPPYKYKNIAENFGEACEITRSHRLACRGRGTSRGRLGSHSGYQPSGPRTNQRPRFVFENSSSNSYGQALHRGSGFGWSAGTCRGQRPRDDRRDSGANLSGSSSHNKQSNVWFSRDNP